MLFVHLYNNYDLANYYEIHCGYHFSLFVSMVSIIFMPTSALLLISSFVTWKDRSFNDTSSIILLLIYLNGYMQPKNSMTEIDFDFLPFATESETYVFSAVLNTFTAEYLPVVDIE